MHDNGYALHNLASLPHITVAGACATATHGSGDSHGNLSTAVHALEIVQASGETVVFSRDQQDGLLEGAVVGLGGLGAVTKITLDVVPAFEMSQRVYENLPLAQLERHFDAIFSSGYSVSLFTDWKQSAFNQVWQKRQLAVDGNGASVQAEPDFFGAAPALEHRHPVPGHTAENCSEQLGIPGPWHERMPHFRMDFTPSAGKELQSEYFVPRSHAYEALRAINQLRERIAPLLYITEVRTIAADKLWMSPSFGQDSVGDPFHVEAGLGERTAGAAGYRGSACAVRRPPALGQAVYDAAGPRAIALCEAAEFRRLLLQCDPEGKFRNDFLNSYIME